MYKYKIPIKWIKVNVDRIKKWDEIYTTTASNRESAIMAALSHICRKHRWENVYGVIDEYKIETE